MTVTKKVIASEMIEELGIKSLSQKTVLSFIDCVLDKIKYELLEGNNVKIMNFGSWNVRHKKSRNGRNPSTGLPMEIIARKVITFKISFQLGKKFNA